MNYDESLDRKIRLEYEKMKPNSNPSNDLVRKTEKRIIDMILAYEDGISHQELADIIGIDRNNLRPYMKRLMQRGMVTRDKGKQGKYHAATKARRGISLTADILANSFMSNILDNDNFNIDIPSLNANRTKLSGLELELLKLSHMLGGFIIYVLIQSKNSANKIAQGSRNVKEKDIAIQNWIEDTISILVRDISSLFFSHVYPHLESIDGDIPPNPSDEYLDSDEFFNKALKPLSEQTVFSELNKRFTNLYPNLSLELEKTRTQLPKLLAEELKHIRDVAEKLKLQKTCTHNYQTIEKYSDNHHRYDRCLKCQKTRKRYVI